jgi:hypothetical protein
MTVCRGDCIRSEKNDPGQKAQLIPLFGSSPAARPDSAGKHRRETTERSGKQPGDPARVTEAVIKAVQSPTPPRHLVLGREGFDNVENQLRSMLQEVDLWKATSLGADYPAA